jgi:transcriptional regulator with XRE-family HTH domain
MPATSELTSAVDQQLLSQLGERLKRARIANGMTATAMAERAGLSRMTLGAVEAGSPSPTMGSYMRVMSVLGMSGDLVVVASDALHPIVLGNAAVPNTRTSSLSRATGLGLRASDKSHETQDLQSLVLHQEAVRLMKAQPELILKALETLEQWRAAGDSHSRFLWDEWSVILHRRAWRRALSHTQRAQELRQASPLATILPPESRRRILAEVKRVKAGIPLHQLASDEPRHTGTTPRV